MDKDVTSARAPESVAVDFDDDRFTDAQLAEHADAGLADAIDGMTQIQDAIAAAGADNRAPSDQLPAINPTFHAMASLAASAALSNRILERIASLFERAEGTDVAQPGDTRVQS